MSSSTQFAELGAVAAEDSAQPSPLIEAFFPPDVAAAELRIPGNPLLLYPVEALAISRAVFTRMQEFAAGRLCARSALSRMGAKQTPVRSGADRQPQWPEGFVGSITHTTGFCAAVVGRRGRFAGIGIDSEIANAADITLWSSICVAEELQWIESLSSRARARAATFIFAAKEAFYKCQYPITREWLDFHDVRITPHSWSMEHGTFVLEARRPLSVFGRNAPLGPLQGSYSFHEQFVSVGVALTLEGVTQQ
jgi:4'-phosphopantetheinyl transferase EntD